MSLLELLLIAIGLSLDAFAAAVCKGLSRQKPGLRQTFTIALWFGVFQGLMPIIGYLLGSRFQAALMAVDHWIAFTLLGIIGAHMIREANAKGEGNTSADTGFKTMFPLALATSIDALAIGITFAFLQVNIVWAAPVIAVTTFILALAGVKAGCAFGGTGKATAERIGGIILILLGTKILLEHLGWLPF